MIANFLLRTTNLSSSGILISGFYHFLAFFQLQVQTLQFNIAHPVAIFHT